MIGETEMLRPFMFMVVGMILATGGIGITDWQLYATLIAMAVASA
jgi:hypothetical protein